MDELRRGLRNRMTTMRRESVRAWKAGPCVRSGCWVWRCVRWLGAEYWAGYRDGGLRSKKYSLEQGERDEVCVRSSGLNAVSGFGSEETDRLECGGKECLSKGDCCKLGYTIAVEVWAG